MAPFNPQINPTNSPSYGGNSRAVDVPDIIQPRGVQQNQILPKGQEVGDTSAAYEGKAAEYGMNAQAIGDNRMANLFADIGKVGDFMAKAGVEVVKKDIEDRVYNVADAARQEWTDTLEKIKSGVGVKNVLDANASMDAPEDSAPDEVQDLPSKLDALAGARASGKISGTYYTGRLLAEAKDLRARYPGFRQEIDQAFAKVTGMNPANAYITNLVQDINRASAATNSAANKVESFVRSNIDSVPGILNKLELYRAGAITDMDLYKYSAPFLQAKTDLQMKALKLQEFKGTREEAAIQAGELMDTAVGRAVNNNVQEMMVKIGIESPEQMNMFASKVKAGEFTQQQWNDFGRTVQAQKTAIRQKLIADADSQGMTKLLGKKAVLEKIDQGLSMYDELQKNIIDKDVGGFYDNARQIKGMQDTAQRNMLSDPKLGPPLLASKALRENGGDQWMTQFNIDLFTKGTFNNDLQDYLNNWRKGIRAQVSPDGTPTTLNDYLDSLKRNNLSKADTAKMNSAVFNDITTITDKNTPDTIKVGLAKAAFSPGNVGVLNRIDPDTVSANGRPVAGNGTIYQRFTSPEMTAEMKRLGAKDPQIWTNYVNWATTSLGTTIAGQEIGNLKRIGEDPNIKIGWDSDNRRFEIKWSPDPKANGGSAVTQAEAYPPYLTARASVNRLNSALSNYKNIADQSGQDVDAFILGAIRQAGGDLKNVGGLPGQMMREIDNSRTFEGRFQGNRR